MKIKLLTILKSAAVIVTFASSGYFIYKQIQKKSEQLEEEEDYQEQGYQATLHKMEKEDTESNQKKSAGKTRKPRKKTEKSDDGIRRTKTNRVRKEEPTGEIYKGRDVYQGQQGGKYYYNKKGNKTYMKEE